MTLKQCILIKNDCYRKNVKMTKPTGIVVHSTGANNKTIKRYVQPVSEQSYYNEVIADIGKNQYGNHWNQDGISKCVHAFIGINATGTVETYQTLPWDVCCWGVGSGTKGSYNFNPTARIQFEICEDNLTDANYFNIAMKEAQELCAFLCKKYGFGVDKICSHHESYVNGYGSNHGDCDSWLKKFGKTMDWFRSEVQKLINGEITPTPEPTPKGDFDVKTWKNGSTPELVYQTTTDCKNGKNKIGSLDPKEVCECYGIIDGCYLVAYTVTGTNAKKCGFVAYAGGIK